MAEETQYKPRGRIMEALKRKATAEDTPYKPKDAILVALRGAATTGLAGLFAAAVQNTLEKRNVGPWGVFTRSGGTIGIMCRWMESRAI